MNKLPDYQRKVKEIRKYFQVSQNRFAKWLEIKQGSFSDIERGKVRISSEIMEKLIYGLCINPSWFFYNKNSTKIDYRLKNKYIKKIIFKI
jgi:DNA-binding XRE family transcriptional regulator